MKHHYKGGSCRKAEAVEVFPSAEERTWIIDPLVVETIEQAQGLCIEQKVWAWVRVPGYERQGLFLVNKAGGFVFVRYTPAMKLLKASVGMNQIAWFAEYGAKCRKAWKGERKPWMGSDGKPRQDNGK